MHFPLNKRFLSIVEFKNVQFPNSTIIFKIRIKLELVEELRIYFQKLAPVKVDFNLEN